ncbi:MAG: hypothetical protein FWE36_06435 [Erysipelotrichales bacterium]|nr:hypothetical protein [Erysipelotrichales bacterium]
MFFTKYYHYEERNGRLTRITAPDVDSSFRYDNLGNCIMFNGTNLLITRGNLLESFGSSFYRYNSFGMRLSKRVNGVTTFYHYDGTRLLAEWNETGTRSLRYIYDLEEIVGFMADNDLYPYFFIKDIEGNVIGLRCDNMPDMVIGYEYDAYGNHKAFRDTGITSDRIAEITDINHIALRNPIRWKSHYYDQESGLYYINSRYYSAFTKMFINPTNPIKMLYNITIPGTLNPYAIGNHPLFFSVSINNIFPSMPLFWDMPSVSWWQSRYNRMPNSLKWGIGIITIALLTIATIATKGATAPLLAKANKILVGANTGAIVGGTTGAGFGYIADGWNGAASGFMFGTVGGSLTGGYGGFLSSKGKAFGIMATGRMLKMGTFSAGITGLTGYITQGIEVFDDWTFYVALSLSFVIGSIGGRVEMQIDNTTWATSKRGIILGLGVTISGAILDEGAALALKSLSGAINIHEMLILKRM